jgi:hypothetical protein
LQDKLAGRIIINGSSSLITCQRPGTLNQPAVPTGLISFSASWEFSPVGEKLFKNEEEALGH